MFNTNREEDVSTNKEDCAIAGKEGVQRCPSMKHLPRLAE
jgi:hypothetical protein